MASAGQEIPLSQFMISRHELHDVLVRLILPHPYPLPLGEGELSADDLTRHTVTVVHGPNVCEAKRKEAHHGPFETPQGLGARWQSHQTGARPFE
jgi:hypothetical protein